MARYGGRQTVSYLVGDGIGPEMLEHIQRIFTFARVPVDFETIHIGPSEKDLDNAIVSIRRNGVALKVGLLSKPGFIVASNFRETLKQSSMIQHLFPETWKFVVDLICMPMSFTP